MLHACCPLLCLQTLNRTASEPLKKAAMRMHHVDMKNANCRSTRTSVRPASASLILGICLLSASVMGDERAVHTDGFVVYPAGGKCEKHAGMDARTCSLLMEKAEFISHELSWPFPDGGACAASHGSSACFHRDGRWKVRMVGAAEFNHGRGEGQRFVVPVFSSSKFQGLYLPNGYPVQYGWNEPIPRVVPHQTGKSLIPVVIINRRAAYSREEVVTGQMLDQALIPRSLLQAVCLPLGVIPLSQSAEMRSPHCEPLHAYVSARSQRQVADTLFSSKD